MLNNILEQLKNPVKTLIEKSKEEDSKKGVIKLAIISGLSSVINVISVIISIILKYSKDSFWYSSYSADELWEKRWEAIEEAEILNVFFKNWVILAIVIAVTALVLYIIAKMVKSPKEYANNLSMVNNALIIYVVGQFLKIIGSAIYQPIELLIMYVISVYTIFSLIFAFRDSLEIESSDKLVLTTTMVLTLLVVIAVILISIITDVSLSDVITFNELLSL